jgi:hypothetical protein
MNLQDIPVTQNPKFQHGANRLKFSFPHSFYPPLEKLFAIYMISKKHAKYQDARGAGVLIFKETQNSGPGRVYAEFSAYTPYNFTSNPGLQNAE